jgi:hypothetical protein
MRIGLNNAWQLHEDWMNVQWDCTSVRRCAMPCHAMHLCVGFDRSRGAEELVGVVSQLPPRLKYCQLGII